MTAYLKAIASGKAHRVLKTDFIFSPYTYSQRLIRYEFLKYLEEQNVDTRTLPLFDGAIQKMEELVEREGTNPYQHIRLGRAFDKKAEILKDPSFFKTAEMYYKKAISLAPKRQEAYYAYGLSLVRQSRAEEAIKILKDPSALDPDIPISYFYLGLAQFNRGKESYVESLDSMEFFFGRSAENPDQKVSKNIYEKFFYYFYETRDTVHFLASSSRLASLDADQRDLYLKIVDLMQKNEQFPPMEFRGGKLLNVFPGG